MWCPHKGGLKIEIVLETGIWYWHFVDVVWLVLYVLVYSWGGVLFFKGRSFIK